MDEMNQYLRAAAGRGSWTVEAGGRVILRDPALAPPPPEPAQESETVWGDPDAGPRGTKWSPQTTDMNALIRGERLERHRYRGELARDIARGLL